MVIEAVEFAHRLLINFETSWAVIDQREFTGFAFCGSGVDQPK